MNRLYHQAQSWNPLNPNLLSGVPRALKAIEFQVLYGTLPGALQDSYNYKQIASELKINPNRLRKKIGDLSHQGDSRPASSPFVKVSLPPLSSSPEAPSLEQKIFYPLIHTGSIELTRVDGTILKASGLDNKALLSLIQGFLNP